MWSVLLLIAGLAGLLIGAELLVRGGSNLAIRLGVTPIVIWPDCGIDRHKHA
jgi:cation:H+ antiporter